MDSRIRDDNNIEIKKIAIKGKGIKDLLKKEFIEELESNFEDYSLINFSLIIDGNKPSNLVSIGHVSSEDYKNNVLTISAENEDTLNKFFKIL